MEHRDDAALCQYLLRRGLVPVGVLVACAEAQRRARAAGTRVPRLADQLIRRGALTPAGLNAARAELEASGAPAAAPRPGWARGWDESDEAAVARTLGRYQVTGVIARGTAGVVLSGRCTRTGREVAIKVLRGAPGPADPRIRRFQREADLLCSLRHDGVVRGLASGAAEGRPYLVMERVRGPSLRQRLRRQGALPEATVAAIGADLARALAYLHREGVVHRDVKPANVLLGPDGRARLCDLGLARDLEAGPSAAESDDTVGTPCYMAPEQARAAGDAGPRADLYSLGVTLFHAAAGRPPFPGGSGVVVLSRHLFDEVPDVRALRPTVSPALARVIRTLTRRDPAARFDTAHEAAQHLEWIGRPRPLRAAA